MFLRAVIRVPHDIERHLRLPLTRSQLLAPLSMFFPGSLARRSMRSGKLVRSLIISYACALIHVSGFGYSFHSLPPPGADPHSSDKSEGELARAFATVFSTVSEFNVMSVLAAWFPFLRRFVRHSVLLRASPECSCTNRRTQTPALGKRPKLPCSASARSSSMHAKPLI